MENILKRKLRLGIASCQFGAKVRYNGKGNDLTQYLGRDRNEFIWTPVCPEIMSGMGVLRSSIKLSGGNGFDFWNGTANVKNKDGKNLNEMIKKGSIACLETLERAEIDAYVYMEGSPSCGINRTSLKNKRIGNPPGIFGALLLEKDIFLINSIDLQSPIRWWDIKRRLVSFVWIKEQDLKSKETLKNIWDRVKYILYELHENETIKIRDKIRLILNSSDEVINEDYNKIKSELLSLLRKPAELENIKKYLWINYLELKKREDIEIEEIYEPHILRSLTHVAQELVDIEIEVKKKDISFRSSPINYKPR